MTSARFLGFTRTEAARFSLLLSIIAITGAGVLIMKDIVEMGNAEFNQSVLIAIILSFITALITIFLMMRFFERFTFKAFAVYRVILGTLLLYLIYTGVLQ
jgi:undecaprenyl-diphosphatase